MSGMGCGNMATCASVNNWISIPGAPSDPWNKVPTDGSVNVRKRTLSDNVNTSITTDMYDRERVVISSTIPPVMTMGTEVSQNHSRLRSLLTRPKVREACQTEEILKGYLKSQPATPLPNTESNYLLKGLLSSGVKQQDDCLLDSLGFPSPPTCSAASPQNSSSSPVFSQSSPICDASPLSHHSSPSPAGSSKRAGNEDIYIERQIIKKKCYSPPSFHSLPSSGATMSGTESATAAGSTLCEKNKMLASLLATQPPTPTAIPQLPQSVLTATPQERLPRVPPPIVRLRQNSATALWSGGSIKFNDSNSPPLINNSPTVGEYLPQVPVISNTSRLPITLSTINCPTTSGIINGPTTSGIINGPTTSGIINGPTTSGIINGPTTSGIINGPTTSGIINGPTTSGIINPRTNLGTLRLPATAGTINSPVTSGTIHSSAAYPMNTQVSSAASIPSSPEVESCYQNTQQRNQAINQMQCGVTQQMSYACNQQETWQNYGRLPNHMASTSIQDNSVWQEQSALQRKLSFQTSEESVQRANYNTTITTQYNVNYQSYEYYNQLQMRQSQNNINSQHFLLQQQQLLIQQQQLNQQIYQQRYQQRYPAFQKQYFNMQCQEMQQQLAGWSGYSREQSAAMLHNNYEGMKLEDTSRQNYRSLNPQVSRNSFQEYWDLQNSEPEPRQMPGYDQSREISERKYVKESTVDSTVSQELPSRVSQNEEVPPASSQLGNDRLLEMQQILAKTPNFALKDDNVQFLGENDADLSKILDDILDNESLGKNSQDSRRLQRNSIVGVSQPKSGHSVQPTLFSYNNYNNFDVQPCV